MKHFNKLVCCESEMPGLKLKYTGFLRHVISQAFSFFHGFSQNLLSWNKYIIHRKEKEIVHIVFKPVELSFLWCAESVNLPVKNKLSGIVTFFKSHSWVFPVRFPVLAIETCESKPNQGPSNYGELSNLRAQLSQLDRQGFEPTLCIKGTRHYW